MADELSRPRQFATPLCWSHLDDILRNRLAWLHHSLSSNLLHPAEAAEQFSFIVSDLLLEFGLSKQLRGTTNGRHRPRRIETTLQTLSTMKNSLRKRMQSSADFISVVRTHNKVLKYFRRQQHTNELCKNERDFRNNPWEYAHKKLQPSDNSEPSFSSETATSYFRNTYSNSSVSYGDGLPLWVSESIPECDSSLFNTKKITPGLVKSTLQCCSKKSAPGADGITYYHLCHLPSTHHVMATLFNKLIETGMAPSIWGVARIKLIYKSGDLNDPSNFRPIALTSVVGKLLHKILSRRLETYLKANDILDTSIQKGFVSGLPGVFEHIYCLSAIMKDALTNRCPLMMTFLDLKNAFGSVPHTLIFNMLEAVKVPSSIINYIQSFYSALSVIITSKSWETEPIPFQRGVFQGDTLSPVIFLLSFNPLLKLAESLNRSHGYHIKIPIENSEDFPPINSFVYVKWLETGDEALGWYRARIDRYFQDRSCRIVYDDSEGLEVSEVVTLHEVEWKPCSKRARKFVPLDGKPVFTKANWNPSLKFADSMDHSLKGYADDVTLICDDFDTHKSVLQHIDSKASDLDLSFKPAKCVSFLFNGAKLLSQGIALSKGMTRSITDGHTKFLGKVIDVSLSATKKTASKRMLCRLTDLLTATDQLPIRGEYKMWIYRNYIISLLRFHLCVDAVSSCSISKLESIATRFLKKWLNLPRSATRVVLYYPGVCCPSISHVSREAKLSLLACVSASADQRLQELGLQLHLGNVAMQIEDNTYSILSNAKMQLSKFPSARSLYIKAKHLLRDDTTRQCEDHLQSLSVQSKFGGSAALEASCKTWNRLLSTFHPGQLSFLLRAASDTLPTAVNLQRWSIQCDAKCLLCDSTRPTTAHVLSGCPAALNQQRYTFRHNHVLSILALALTNLFTDAPFVKVYADLPGFYANISPQTTIPSNILVTSYRPDIVLFNTKCHSICLLELTCPLDSPQHIQAARDRKQSKVEYLQLLAEFDRLKISNYYDTIEISVLGHYQPSTVKDMLKLLAFVNPDFETSRSAIKAWLDSAAAASISASQRIFLSRNCKEWCPD